MDEEELARVAELLAAQMVEKFPVLQAKPDEVKPDEVKPVEVKPDETTPFNMKDMVSELMNQMGQRDDSKVMGVMFDEKLNTAMSQTPGLEEYLNDKDDYDRVRMDEVTKGSYEDKISMLGSIQKSFIQASANNKGRPPVVSEKVAKRVKETETQYQDIDKKLETGGYGSVQDFADAYFEVFDAEMSAVQ